MRNAPFGGRLTQQHVEGTTSIIREFQRMGSSDLRKLAYILATAFHETGGRMVPVREGFATSDESARRILKNRRYVKPDKLTGHSYYGRGHVQLTWSDNYKRMGKILGIDLYNNPDLALNKDVSAQILVEGMMKGKSSKGDFTGKSLNDYFRLDLDDPIGARRIVNGTDKAELIASYHKSFLDSLHHGVKNDDVEYDIEEQGTPDKPNLLKDNATIGTISAVAGSGIFGFFSSIDSPWAFLAFALLVVGGFLYFTGRIKIVKETGA